jgi:malonate-semialdehyde dehydrogenase (acetylating)/methylmalonate-semialdehyde dehydrogenase
MQSVPYFLNGHRVHGTGEIPIYNPATGDVTAQVPIPDASSVNDVMEGAKTASRSWRASALSQRTNILFAFLQLLFGHAHIYGSEGSPSTPAPR